MFRAKLAWTSVSLLLLSSHLCAQATKNSPNALVTGIWFSQSFGLPEALTAKNDLQLKTTLIATLRGKSPALNWDYLKEIFGKDDFERLSGGKKIITLEAMERMLNDKIPHSREGLFPKVRQHADLLTTQFDMIEERHREAADELAAWIAKNYRSGKPLAVIVICTGNSRRSILGSTMGNVAAGYYGLPDLRFYSGGTAPSAFNPRTIATLKEIGAEIESTGKEAPRGSSGEANPIYRVRWSKDREALEFSKLYSDAQNAQKDFAAVLVCSEADAACPSVAGASKRIAVPYMDPKAYDGAPFEAAKYAERRDDIGRFMLNVAMQVRRRVKVDDGTK